MAQGPSAGRAEPGLDEECRQSPSSASSANSAALALRLQGSHVASVLNELIGAGASLRPAQFPNFYKIIIYLFERQL